MIGLFICNLVTHKERSLYSEYLNDDECYGTYYGRIDAGSKITMILGNNRNISLFEMNVKYDIGSIIPVDQPIHLARYVKEYFNHELKIPVFNIISNLNYDVLSEYPDEIILTKHYGGIKWCFEWNCVANRCDENGMFYNITTSNNDGFKNKCKFNDNEIMVQIE